MRCGSRRENKNKAKKQERTQKRKSIAAARRAAGAQYLISYADAATLIGRQTGVGGGGLFVFERVGEGEWWGGGDEGWE